MSEPVPATPVASMPADPSTAGAGRRLDRIDAIDAARGAALAAMASYHFAWDLGFLQLTPVNAALTPAGRLAAHGIAGTFLTLVGIGLVLANGGGVRLRPYALRLARIGGAALAITVATWWLFPSSFIFFGVLHCIAVSSVLALPFLSLPAAITAFAAALVIAAPSFVHAPIFDSPALLFLGLAGQVPDTNDWVPLCPWFGMVLAGAALARAGLPALARSSLGRWRARGPVGRLATAAGRHSLAVYLVHQPVLLALLYGVLALTGPHPKAGVAEFRAEFQGNCTRTGGSEAACRIAGRCVAAVLRREGLWGSGPYSLEQRAKAQGLAQHCYQAAEGTAAAP